MYRSNTELYADPSLREGVDYGRRFHRHGAVDDDRSGTAGPPSAVVIAMHGGGIEAGTSELCLAVAGYHPATLAPVAPGAPLYDYWMFEGLRDRRNTELHVTSTGCDDPQAVSLCAAARYAISLHGCTPAQAGLPGTGQAVLVGGLDAALKAYLREELAAAGITALDGAADPALAGVSPRNIVNRTLTGAGAQLELTTPLRDAMFGENTRARRGRTTLPAFWTFVNATRAAVARRSAD